MRNLQLRMIQLSTSRVILTYLDVYSIYKRACMGTSREKYYMKMYENLVDYNDCNNAPLSNDKIRQTISKVIIEKEADERDITSDCHNVTMDNFFQYPVTTNTQGENANAISTSERVNNSDVLAKTLKLLKINNDIH